MTVITPEQSNALLYANKTFGFIGAGNMANAIAGGIIKAGWPADGILASNPTLPKLASLKQKLGINITQDNQEVAREANILVLAVKPQKLGGVCAEIASIDLSDKLIISVAAGWPISKIEAGLKQKPAIVRAMPNTPALIGESATGLFANKQTSTQQQLSAIAIFQSIGVTCWINSESLMDTVTAIAGSSPAYVFLMMQAMIEQAMESGMAEKDAFTLVTQAFSGAAQLAQQTPDKSLDTLRKEVTSPGGTTAAAITSFKSDGFEQIVKKAVIASIKRGQELGNQ